MSYFNLSEMLVLVFGMIIFLGTRDSYLVLREPISLISSKNYFYFLLSWSSISIYEILVCFAITFLSYRSKSVFCPFLCLSLWCFSIMRSKTSYYIFLELQAGSISKIISFVFSSISSKKFNVSTIRGSMRS